MLIAAALDFSGQGWDPGGRDRMAATMALGLGGRVNASVEHGALLYHRSPPHVAASGPAHAPNGDTVLFAGQIHDRAGLRERLGVEPGRPMADAQLYAHAHAAPGEDCDRLVNGCYTAIVLDGKSQELRAVRSPINPPPLCWWRDGSRLIVASTPRVMFAAGHRAEIDWAHFDNSQLLNMWDLSRSWYRGISRIEPGQSIRWTPSGEHRHRFWSARDLPRVNLGRDDDYPEAARELMLRATREMLADFRRPGIMLSGGLDSQAVAAAMLDVLPPGQDLPSYTRVPEPGFTGEDSDRQILDESGNVRALAKMYPRLQPQFIHPGGQDFGKVLQETFLLGSAASMVAANMPWIDAICGKAAQDGCDVLLTGQNGNAGFSYKAQPAIAEWTRQGRWLRVFTELRHFRDDRSLPRRILYHAVLPNLPRSIQRGVALRAGSGRRQPFETWSGMRADHAAETGAMERSLENGFDPLFLPMKSTIEERMLMLEAGAGDAADIGLALQLKSGLQLRDPTAYRPLVEFCFGIPAEQFRRDGMDRRLARRMLKGRVPEAVRQETRVGFQCADWPLGFGRMRGELLGDLRRMAANPEIARRIDCERLTRDLEQWDGNASREAAERILWAVSRAVAAGRFVDYVEGRNL